jgi:outer membrane autotransporter protein
VTGAGFGFARGQLSTNGDGAIINTDSDTFQGDLYAGLTRDEYYLGGILSLASHQYNARRHVRFDTMDRTASSNYSGLQYSAFLEGGRTFSSKGLFLTPFASLQYAELHLDDYDEGGAGALSLQVDSQQYHLLQTGLGARLSRPIKQEGVTMTPELQARWLYDFAADSQATTGVFREASGFFATKGPDAPESGFTAGASLTLDTTSNVTVVMGYDYEWKKRFAGHSGRIEVNFAF